MISPALLLSMLCLFLWDAQAFTLAPLSSSRTATVPATRATESSSAGASMPSFDDDDDDDQDDAAQEDAPKVPPGMNPDFPELPELKGDFDWDAKFGGDDDWITEQVPGKVTLNEIELAAQVTALSQLEDKWRRETILAEDEEAQQVGFVERAELLNGRTAMFFLVTGLLTEYWTGYSLPAQVEEMLRVGGFIGPEGW